VNSNTTTTAAATAATATVETASNTKNIASKIGKNKKYLEIAYPGNCSLYYN